MSAVLLCFKDRARGTVPQFHSLRAERLERGVHTLNNRIGVAVIVLVLAVGTIRVDELGAHVTSGVQKHGARVVATIRGVSSVLRLSLALEIDHDKLGAELDDLLCLRGVELCLE